MKILSCLLLAMFLEVFALDACFAEEDVRIGALFSLSSWGAAGGKSELNGALLARDEINASGGIGGRHLRLLAEDNQSDLKGTASAFRKLVSIDQVVAVVGPNWAEFIEVAAPLAESAKVPLISPSGYKKSIFEGKKFTFTLWPPHSIATKPLADFMATKGYRRAAVLLSENAYLEGLFDALREQLEVSKIHLEPLMRFNHGQGDFRSAITQLAVLKPDAVLVLLIENGDLGRFLVQARQLRLTVPLYSTNVLAFDEEIKKTPSMAEGVVYFDFVVPGGEAFFEKYRARFGEAPGFSSAKAYDAVFLLKKAIEECGFKPEEIVSCLRRAGYDGVSGRIAFDGEGVLTSRAANTELFHVSSGSFLRLDAAKGGEILGR